MANKITQLDVPSDAEAHARRFGAKRDPVSQRWYVAAYIPRELLNYIPRVANRPLHEPEPTCPKCGVMMRKRYRQDGDAFWGCSAYFRTGCKGIIEYRDFLEALAPAKILSHFLPLLGDAEIFPMERLISHSVILKVQAPDHLNARWAGITQDALGVLGSEKRVLRWLEQPKSVFNNKSPIEIMDASAGCDKVEAALRDVWR
jgi:ssDNA-binding Zn-finger/Zn-ribbon topoisomerase 1